MKTDLPKLLGYAHAEIMMYDNPGNNLYCMSITGNEEQDQLEEGKTNDFEREFIIDEKSVVRFPPNMGITGYALKGDAVCFLNNFPIKRAQTIGPLHAQSSSSRGEVLSLLQQAFVGHLLAEGFPYNKKIDNFLELETIENFAISSI